jgi:ribose transport system substrate-binding protein
MRKIGDKSSRRTYLKTIAAGSVLLAGCSGSDGGDGSDGGSDGGDTENQGSGGSNDGGSTGGKTETQGGGSSGPYDIGIVHSTLNLGGATLAQARGAQWYADSKDNLSVNVFDGGLDPTKQNQQLESLIQQDVDAIGVVPLNASAVTSRVEDARDRGIPVFTADTFATTDLVTHGSSKNQYADGQKIAKHLVEVLKEQRGSPEGRYVLVSAPTKRPVVQRRSDGIRSILSQHENVTEVDELIVDPASVQNAVESVSSYLQKGTNVDTMVTNWIGGSYGIMNALDRFDMKYPASSGDHIPVVGIDCDSKVLSDIGNGFHDGAISPGEQFQYPIALALMTRYLDAGKDESALPEIGDTIESGAFEFPDSVNGVDVFGKQIWAPAEVRKAEGANYPYVPVGSVLATEENYQKPYLYGNFLQELE